jgi:hypothetical protein
VVFPGLFNLPQKHKGTKFYTMIFIFDFGNESSPNKKQNEFEKKYVYYYRERQQKFSE